MNDIPYFDDTKSFLHAVLGYMASVNQSWSAAIMLGFLVYQLTEMGDSAETTVGDLAEFATGYLYGKVVDAKS